MRTIKVARSTDNGGQSSPSRQGVRRPIMDPDETFRKWREMADLKLKSTEMRLIRRQPVDIEFTDLTYSVPLGRSQNKLILRNLSGYFKSGELTAILGPSGAGKSTLLNVLAGYNYSDGPCNILINGKPRNLKSFKSMSRYIMQEDVHQPCLTVFESMHTSACLKLGKTVTEQQRTKQILEILDLLGLQNSKDTISLRLSGGQKKRLSIALELVNNPPVLFLDEPTTGLDDLSSSQCVHLLKSLAKGGRTVICSIHTPSARLFALFDNVYIVSEGQCVFQGKGEEIVPFLSELGLQCPITYNPADFIIEVASGEYGYYQEKLVNATNNGRVYRWSRSEKHKPTPSYLLQDDIDEIKDMPIYGCSQWQEFIILFTRMCLQIFRDWNIVIIKTLVHVGIGIVVGTLFYNFGQDASKTLYNFGFCFLSIIIFLYVPMLPAIVWFPLEVKSVKREYFNRWYRLKPYFLALTISRLPFQIIHGAIYIAIAYLMSDQPLEWERILKFSLILGLVSLASEAYGMVFSARLHIVNGVFIGPALSVPLMLLSVYGFGSKLSTIPMWIQIAMNLSFTRFAMEGLVMAIYGDNRKNLICPEEEIYCPYGMAKILIKDMGMEKADYWLSVSMLCVFYLVFKISCFLILRHRLKRKRSSGVLWMVGRFIKTYMNIKR